ncbi:MAG: hypothetical protein ACOYLS_13045 [Polymorphobacter sp.]
MMLVALLLAAAMPCSMAAPAQCSTTSELMWAPGTETALKGFFGTARGDYLMPNALVWKQAREALGGPPEEPLRLKDVSLLFSACRAHSCPEKGAMVVTPAGKIRAAALLHYRCTRAGCANNARLALFYRQPAEADGLAMRALIGWARGLNKGETPPLAKRRLGS